MKELSEYDQKAADFLNATSTALIIKYKTFAPHFVGEKTSRSIFRCRLINKLGSFSFDFGQSEARGSEKPTAYNILTCITKNDPGSFEDFCDELGYEEYSDSGRRNMQSWIIYCAVLKEWNAIHKLFSEEQIEQLQEIQ